MSGSVQSANFGIGTIQKRPLFVIRPQTVQFVSSENEQTLRLPVARGVANGQTQRWLIGAVSRCSFSERRVVRRCEAAIRRGIEQVQFRNGALCGGERQTGYGGFGANQPPKRTGKKKIKKKLRFTPNLSATVQHDTYLYMYL